MASFVQESMIGWTVPSKSSMLTSHSAASFSSCSFLDFTMASSIWIFFEEKNYRFTIYIYHLTVKATFNIVQENFKRLVKSTSVFYAPRIHIFFTEKGLLTYSLLTNLSLINCEIKLLQIKVSLPYLDNIFINTMYIRQFF